MTTHLCLPHIPMPHLGYGRAGVELYAACERAGVSMSRNAFDGDAELVVSLMPPRMVKQHLQGQRRWLFTMYETDPVPVEFRELSHFETVLVPCEANRESFAEHHADVRVVPLGIDPNRWVLTDRPSDGPFTFLTSGSEIRKGADVVIAAFQKAFCVSDKVQLLVKFPEKSDVEVPNDSRIKVVSGYMAANDEISLYASAHCYVGVSRGEGFGMMPLQAMAQGCPTILTDAHGHAGFARFGLPVSTRMVPAADYMCRGEKLLWWEPSLDETVEQMRHVFNNYERELLRARKNSARVRKQFSWDAAATALLDTIGVESLRRYTGNGEPTQAPVRMVPLVVNRDVQPNIGSVQYSFAKNREYWVPLGVKEVLWESGYLPDSSWHDDRYKFVEVA